MASLREILQDTVLRLSKEPLIKKWNKAPYLCSQCGETIQKKDICSHLLIHVRSKAQHCDSCTFGFSTEKFLLKHLAEHVEDIAHQPRKAKRPSNLRKHVKRTKFFQASLSKAKKRPFESSGSETEVDLPSPRQCKKRSSYCEEEVQQWDTLSVDEPKLLAQNDPLKCVVCERVFNSSDEVSRHMVVHLSELPFKCALCEMRFGNRDVLADHMLVHASDTCQKCDMCDKSYASKSALRRHKIKCHKVRHRCGACKRYFNSEKGLKIHLKVSSCKDILPKAAYKCVHCKKAFESLDLLSKHVAKHEPEEGQIEECLVCGEGFSSKTELENHLTTHSLKLPPSVALTAEGLVLPHEKGAFEKGVNNHTSVEKQIGKGVNNNTSVHNGNNDVIDLTDDALGVSAVKNSMNFQVPFDKKPQLDVPEVEDSDKPFVCTVCGKGFTRNFKLSEHMMLHTGERPYTCPDCGKGFRVKHRLTEHMMTHSGERPYKCDICNAGFKVNHLFVKHMLAHAGEKPFKCTKCGESFALSRELSAHAATHNGYVAIRCSVCGKGMTSNEDIAAHMATHIQQTPYSGSKQVESFDVTTLSREMPYSDRGAGVGFNLNQGITGNVAALTPEIPYSARGAGAGFTLNQSIPSNGPTIPYCCKICGEYFSSNLGFSAHMAMHGKEMPHKDSTRVDSTDVGQKLPLPVGTPIEEKVFECFVCGDDFFSDSELSVHMKRHTEEMVYKSNDLTPGDSKMLMKEDAKFSIPSNSKRPPYTCTICGDNFDKSAKLEIHVQKHTGIKPFKCTLCDKAYFANVHLVKHMRSHNAVKSYKCSECDKLFTTCYKLKEHMMVHTDERPFACTICGNAYRTNRYLTKHMLKHNQDMAFHCTQCGQGFQERQRLKDHLVLHTGVSGTAYDCKVCGNGYLRGVDLSNHMKSHDKNEVKPFCCIVCGKMFGKEQFLTAHIKFKHTVNTAMESA